MNRDTKIIDKRTGRIQRLGRLLNLYGQKTVVDKWQNRYNLAINGYETNNLVKMTNSLMKEYTFENEKAARKVARHYSKHGTLRHPDQFTNKGVLRKNYKQLNARQEFEAEIKEIETKSTKFTKVLESMRKKKECKDKRAFLKNVKNLSENPNFDTKYDPITSEYINLPKAMYIDKNFKAGNRHIYNPNTLKQCKSKKIEYRYLPRISETGEIILNQHGYPLTTQYSRAVDMINERTGLTNLKSPFTRQSFTFNNRTTLPSNVSIVSKVSENPLYSSTIRYKVNRNKETRRIINE